MQDAAQHKLSSHQFSDYVRSMSDLYKVAVRNGFYLPSPKSSAVTEVMLYNVLQGKYWCPKFSEIKLLPCVKAPVKQTLLKKIFTLFTAKGFNVAWIDEQHTPNKDWMVAVIATLDPSDEIFKKDHVAPPVRKRMRDIETIELPSHLFEGLPKSQSKVKARRLKILGEAFAQEKASKLKDMRRALEQEILEQEIRVDALQTRKRAKTMATSCPGP